MKTTENLLKNTEYMIKESAYVFQSTQEKMERKKVWLFSRCKKAIGIMNGTELEDQMTKVHKQAKN